MYINVRLFGKETLVSMVEDLTANVEKQEAEVDELRDMCYRKDNDIQDLRDRLAGTTSYESMNEQITNLQNYQVTLQERILELQRLYVSNPLDRPAKDGTHPVRCTLMEKPIKTDKIGAIKAVRSLLNMGLKECKDFVEGAGPEWYLKPIEVEFLNSKLKDCGHQLKLS